MWQIAYIKLLAARGIARIGLMIEGKVNIVYFNKIYPLSGSLYAHNWGVISIFSVDLVSILVNLAEERWDVDSLNLQVMTDECIRPPSR